MAFLLAKSGEDVATLLEHTQDVADAGNAIWQSVSNDLRSLIPSLPEQLIVWRAAAEKLHDVMKANSAYQKMVATAGKTEDRQPVRHELLAVAFLSGDGPLAAWFAKLMPNDNERWAVVWAIAAHHFKMIDPVRNAKAPAYRDAKVAPNVTLFFGHPDVRQILTDTASLFGSRELPALKDLPYLTIDDDDESLRQRVTDYLDRASAVWEMIGRKAQDKTLIAVMKALLAAADAAGSATAEQNLPTAEWVTESLNRRLSLADLQPVLTKDLGANRERAKPFQTAVGSSENAVTVVTAGCGNGKTTAAYLWAAKWAIGKKLYFLYPTTGTATAGYEDYLAPHGDLDKALLHGRSQVDLAAIHGTNEESADDAAKKIESLRAWNPKVASCTVDTVLGLMQTQRRGVYSFPAFAAGAFVFDEVHAYDAKLWGGMLRFLKEFPGARALLMSASIPPHRQKQLREIVGDRMGDIIKGDAELEGHKRYRLRKRDSAAACFEEVKTALAKKQKVLWVCNTVKDAIETAKLFRESSSIEPIIYHSRFRYCDRVKRQKRVIEEFKYHKNGPLKGQRLKPEASLVIATQVCEMSLDISADLLVTAECPLPSLVQRMGRLNRYAKGDDPWPCLVYPFEGLPYNEKAENVELHGDCIASMKAAREAVKGLENAPCSQRDLAERLDAMIDSEVPEMYSALFDDGWVTEPMPVRDSEQSITIIREADLEEIESDLGKNRKFWSAGKLAPWTIPMNYPKWLKPFDWPTVGPYPRALDEFLSYTVVEGAQWVRKTGE